MIPGYPTSHLLTVLVVKNWHLVNKGYVRLMINAKDGLDDMSKIMTTYYDSNCQVVQLKGIKETSLVFNKQFLCCQH